MTKDIKWNLLCMCCNQEQADHIAFDTKISRDSGKEIFAEPEIVCHECYNRQFADAVQYGFKKAVSFKDLGGSKGKRLIGWLTRKKGMEMNVLASKFWKAKLWNARYVTKGDLSKEAREATHADISGDISKLL